MVRRGHREGGLNARSKNFKTGIKKSSQEITPKGSEPHHYFLFRISQQIQSLEASKVWAKMGLGWQTN